LQSGEELSEADRKKTRIVSKTILQEWNPRFGCFNAKYAEGIAH
jgi:hypothetical protein